MPEKPARIRIKRYRPGVDDEPTWEKFEVPFREDMMVLDVVTHIKDFLDGSLSFRCSCRMGVCGSCGMMVNGTPRLTCGVFVRDYHPEEIVIEPLDHFPIIRDMVVELEPFMEKLKNIEPYIQREQKRKLEEGEFIQTQEQVDDYRQFSMCINCMLCYSACPVVALEENFLGPAAIAIGYRYNEDTRDEGNDSRNEVLRSHDGIWNCSFVGECSRVCPKHVDPAAAIQRAKVEATQDFFQSIMMPWKKKKAKAGAKAGAQAGK